MVNYALHKNKITTPASRLVRVKGGGEVATRMNQKKGVKGGVMVAKGGVMAAKEGVTRC